MTILKALKNFIAKCGGTTEAKTIAGAINDIPASGGYKKYELKTSSDMSGPFAYLDGLTLEEFKEIFENKDPVMTISDADGEGITAEIQWMSGAYCDDSDSSYYLVVGDSGVAEQFIYDPEDGLFKNTNK